MILTAIILPLIAALSAGILGRKSVKAGRCCLILGATGHLILSLLLWMKKSPGLGTWLGLDCVSNIVLLLTSLLFAMTSFHCLKWLQAELEIQKLQDAESAPSSHGKLMPEWIFIPCLLAFLATMTLAISSANLGLMWVAIEATTLVSAPLICFHHSPSSLEAMWKYLLICSVGIALALLGTFFLALADPAKAGLHLTDLIKRANELNPTWCKAAFILILAGYGTKMGLAPFHTWLPDAHSEAPAPVSALLSAALLNCSFLGIIRFAFILPAELNIVAQKLLFALGFLSLVVAAFFILRQGDYKRMLAYSSVEHMGLLAIGLGCVLLHQGEMWTAMMTHLVGHSLLKMTLFLLAGNLLLAYGTRSVASVKGVFSRLPMTGCLFLAGVLLICGAPPSPLFVTEFIMVKNLGFCLGGLLLLLLFIICAGMLSIALKMCMGTAEPAEPDTPRFHHAENLFSVPAILLTIAIVFGVMCCQVLLAQCAKTPVGF